MSSESQARDREGASNESDEEVEAVKGGFAGKANGIKQVMCERE